MAVTPPAAASAENPIGVPFNDLMDAGFRTSNPPPIKLEEKKAPPAAASPEKPTGDSFIKLMDAGFNASSRPPMWLTENKAPPAAASPEKPTGHAFIDLLDAGFNASSRPPMGLTENNSPTFLSSGDPCLDFFFHVVPDTSSETINRLLTAAWDQDPLTALKLVCHLCGVRGTGKSDRSGFYTSALWLYVRHPETLARNADLITGFGYLKDLPEILHRLVAGDIRKTISQTKEERLAAEMAKVKIQAKEAMFLRQQNLGIKEERLAAEIQAEEAKFLRQQKQYMMAAKAANCYADDPNLRLLRDKTSDLFAALLSSDLEKLELGDMEHLSLAAKWCPFPGSAYDHSILLCEAIARRLFPRESDTNAYRDCYRLHIEVLIPLREALHLPEVYMNSGQWWEVKYSCVSSGAMMNYKKLFLKNDAKRFSKFLDEVKKGKAKIAAGTLLPHQVLAAVREAEYDEVAELQWQRIVRDLSEKGKLSNCIAVCDVSRRMTETQMEVCVALGLLISELSEEPWNGRLITFSEEPQVHQITGETLQQKAEFIGKINRGMSTNFLKVFDEILRLAVERKLEAEKMIKRVFVFSDMEFSQASVNLRETDYEVICRKFVKSGYGSVVPEIVFWNLRDSRSTPVSSWQKGVALVSGYSGNLMKMFLEGDGILSPRDVMEVAIAGEEYNKLMVFD